MTNTAVIYGDSLYDLCTEENLTEELLSQTGTVKDIFEDNPDYIRVLNEPSVPKADRLKLLDEAFAGKIHAYLLNFLKLLCEKGIIAEYCNCAKQYKKRYCIDNGIVEATVTSAVKLNEQQREQLIAKLEKISGNKIVLIEKIDDKFIAGLKVDMDGKQYDGTVSERIKTIRKAVSDIIV